jgi:hypothetical protein
VVQDLSLKPRATRYRRERSKTPNGETIVAELDPGIVGGYGPHPHRLVLGLALQRASRPRADRRASRWHGRGDFEAAGGLVC